jgi:hypothetical protein
MTEAKITDWTIYEDRHMGEMTYFVGRSSWQTATSYTYHVSGELFSRREANQALAWARTLTVEEAEANKRGTDTWGRFEAYCDAQGIADPF